jgi:2-C-methyl-D-erythritol 4-phosphate cytidylyltransferase
MGTDKTKQWLLLENEPLFVHSLRAFEKCKRVKEIILVVKKEEMNAYSDVAKKYGIKKLSVITAGGPTRADSAFIGFKKISDKSTHVAIHDAARCLVTPDMINKVLNAALTFASATAACKSTDTAKISDEFGIIKSTPERSKVWLAQTPQIFETEIYRASSYVALADTFTVTDDCSLAEHAGFSVKLVDCGKENLKITEPIDIYFAEAVLKKRRDEAENE